MVYVYWYALFSLRIQCPPEPAVLVSGLGKGGGWMVGCFFAPPSDFHRSRFMLYFCFTILLWQAIIFYERLKAPVVVIPDMPSLTYNSLVNFAYKAI